MGPHANTFLLVTILVLVTVLLIYGMKYFSAARQAQVTLAGGDAYRDLAEKSTAALTAVQSDLADMKAQLASIEKMLREVG